MTYNEITGYTVRTNTDNTYIAPEQRYVNLSDGVCANRGRLSTGWIISIDDDRGSHLVRTLSGSSYLLGEPASGTVDDAAALIRSGLALLSDVKGQSGYHPIVLRGLLVLSD